MSNWHWSNIVKKEGVVCGFPMPVGLVRQIKIRHEVKWVSPKQTRLLDKIFDDGKKLAIITEAASDGMQQIIDGTIRGK